MNEENLINHYNKHNESKRLKNKHANIEFIPAMKYIHEYVKPGSSILDIGAAMGAYSIPLSEEGFDVTALQSTEGNVDTGATYGQAEGGETGDGAGAFRLRHRGAYLRDRRGLPRTRMHGGCRHLRGQHSDLQMQQRHHPRQRHLSKQQEAVQTEAKEGKAHEERI